MAEAAPQPVPGCPRCRKPGHKEYFKYWHDEYRFDVHRAKQMVQDGRQPVEVEEESVRLSVEECTIHAGHLPHVDLSRPGIIAHVWYTDPEDGTVYRGHLLIDGNHRASRCLAEGRPFLAYLLTEEESRAIVLRSPDTHPEEPAEDGPAPEAAPGDLQPTA